MGKIIGIDLGTTNSVVAVVEGGEPKVLINAQGNRTTPSVVAFTDKGERLVGQPAKNQQLTNPQHTVYSVKRFMGRRHSEVLNEEKMVPYTVTGSGDEPVKIQVRDKDYMPQEIAAMVLAELKAAAEDQLGEKVTEAVVTVPAYFNDAQRQATKEAGEIAGLEVKRIINEPTAAAIAYGLDKKADEKIAVFDLGGGTFDVSILDIGETDGTQIFEVLSTNGDTHLGGDDWDEALINHIADEFKGKEGIDLRTDVMALQRLKEAAERAKRELSTAQETTVNLPFITATQEGPKHLQQTITRAKFESITDDLFSRLREPVMKALADAKLKAGEIDEVVLVGGSTRMPKVQSMAEEIFGKEPNRSINPDEVVGLGAAVQGHAIGSDSKDVLLLDVTPLSLGIETEGGVMTPLIERNTTIPHSKDEVFSTAADNQTAVDIHVLQGERQFSKDNRTLGRFRLDGIPPASRGTPQIKVEFNIDANGILNVKATDTKTGKSQHIEIKSDSGLSKDEIEQMKADAEAHADDDRKKRELVDARNKADHLVYTTKKTLEEQGEAVAGDLRGRIESAITQVEEAMKGDNAQAITTAADALANQVTQLDNAGGDAGTPPEGAGATAGGGGDDDVIDADYEVKD